MIRVVELEKTCEAVPAQWEGKTDDGRFVYVRYRYGWLAVSFGETMDEAVDGRTCTPFHAHVGGQFDGHMTESELAEHTRGVVEWPDQ